jgi:hypothetical protein
MPHLKCEACKIRLHSSEARGDDVGDLCPGCGAPLEPVSDLSEIVGFQAASRDPARTDMSPGHRRLADRIGEIRAARAALDDGGGFSPEAVAQAAALPRPKTDS